MLLKDTMSILQNHRIIVVASLKECNSKNRWNRCPQQKVLVIRSARNKRSDAISHTLRSRRMFESNLSPTRKCKASGMSTNSSGLERINFPTSDWTVGLLNRSAMYTAMAGSIFCAVRIAVAQEVWELYGISMRFNKGWAELLLTSNMFCSLVLTWSVPRLASLLGLAHTASLKISFSTRSRSGRLTLFRRET